MIWTAAAPHWTNHQYRSAVRDGGEALNRYWKDVLGRTGVQDTQFWGETLSTEPRAGRPRLRWQDTGNERTDRGIREGLPQLAKGLNLMIRNVTTHGGIELSEQEAMEQLGAYSYLARMLDRCTVEGREVSELGFDSVERDRPDQVDQP